MTDKTDAAIQQYKDASQQVDADNTIQRIYNTIKDLKKDPDATRKRWIWELLQNAHDAGQVKNNKGISVKIKYSKEELVFLHNGKGFNASEIAHVIKSGSTKDETDETTHGQYGTGLLTTHVLSPKIQISGLFKDDSINIWFDFPLVRDDDSPTALRESLDKAEKAFNRSFSSHKPSKLGDFTTRFGLPISEEDAKSSVKTGIEMLKQCAPYVLIFNETFHSITIEDHEGTRCFKVANPSELELNVPQQITVTERNNENERERKYLFAKNKEKTSVIVPLESNDDEFICLGVEQTPRMFKGLPLVGTGSYSFPAIINSSNFNVKSTRDNLPLQEGEENKINRKIIEEACVLLVALVEDAASNKWHHVSQWVKMPPIENQSDSGVKWLREHVKKNFIEKIRQKRVVLNADENAIALSTARLPLLNSENGEGVKMLWDLLENVQGFRETLPRRDEATKWCNAIKSWADVYQGEPMSLFSEVTDGTKLASFIQESTHKDSSYGRIEDLQDLLLEEEKGISAVEWLNQLHIFFSENGLHEVVHEYRIVLDQSGTLDMLSALYRDENIDKELKEIAELLDWQDSQNNWTLRQLLRDKRLTSLAEEVGKGSKDNKEVLGDLIEKLKELAEDNDNIDDNFKKASVRLFAWIVDQKDWNSLRGFPVFAKDSKSDIPIFDLPTARAGEPPLAPIRSWPEDLQQFSELFPSDRILDDSFFAALPSPDTWKMLDDEKKLIRWNMLICRDEVDLKMLSPDPEVYEDNKTEHKATHPIRVTDVVGLEKILKEVVYDSRERGYKFWQFLTEWLVNKDIQQLEIVSEGASCECGQTHEYYPAAWVMQVRKVNWLRDGTPRHFPEAEHLAKLLQEKGWELSSLNENSGTEKLLKAMNVDQSTLKRLFIPDTVINTAVMLSENPQLARHMEDNEKRHQIEQILDTAGDDLSLVNEAVRDGKFLQEYKKKKKRDLTVQANKDLGLLVEEMIGEILREKGFDVEPNHRGWDFDMTGHITELKVVQNSSSKTWRVEVKSTRTEGNDQGVYMSAAQAEEAVEYRKQYVLCIVPLEQEDAIPENIREKMLFIEDIGNRVAPLWVNLNKLKKVQDQITTDTSSDLELIIEEGKPRVLVKKSIWNEVGFRLVDLLERLRDND